MNRKTGGNNFGTGDNIFMARCLSLLAAVVTAVAYDRFIDPRICVLLHGLALLGTIYGVGFRSLPVMLMWTTWWLIFVDSPTSLPVFYNPRAALLFLPVLMGIDMLWNYFYG